MKPFYISLAAILITTSVLAAESQPHVDYEQMAAYLPGTADAAKWDQRNKALRSILDPSKGRARETAKLAADYAQLHPDSVVTVLQLTPWFSDISAQLKTNEKYVVAERLARRCFSVNESMCLRFTLNSDGELVERIGPLYNPPPEDKSPIRRKLREVVRKIIKSAAPLPKPPNSYPLGKGLLFEFYLSADQHLEVTVFSNWG